MTLLRQKTGKELLHDGASLSVFSAQMQASGKKKKELRYRSVISDIFDGSILSLVQCLTCDRVSCLVAVSHKVESSSSQIFFLGNCAPVSERCGMQ